MDFENIPEELKAKARECASPEELLELAKEEGYELSEKDLEAVSGGDHWMCPDEGCLVYGKPCSAGSARPPRGAGAGEDERLGVM